MSTKRARVPSQRDYDVSRFPGFEASERHTEARVKRSLIPERGFDFHSIMHRALYRNMEARGWFQFLSHPEAAVVPIVREFYANAFEHSSFRVFVRGKLVPFDRDTINSFYGVPRIDDDDYHSYLENKDYNQVISFLCRPGTTWRTNESGNPICFLSKHMSRDGKVIHHLVGSKLMPVTHFSDVHKDRAWIMYAILTGMSIDIGQVIEEQILNTACNATGGYGFPSLITALCRNAGVVWSPNEELLHPKKLVDRTSMLSFKGWNEESSSTIAGSKTNHRAPPALPAPSRNLNMLERLEALERGLKEERRLNARARDFMVDFNAALVQQLHLIASGIGVDKVNFPPPIPNYSRSHSNVGEEPEGVHDDEENDDEEHDDEEHEE